MAFGGAKVPRHSVISQRRGEQVAVVSPASRSVVVARMRVRADTAARTFSCATLHMFACGDGNGGGVLCGMVSAVSGVCGCELAEGVRE